MGSDHEEDHHGPAVQGFGHFGSKESSFREGKLPDARSERRNGEADEVAYQQYHIRTKGSKRSENGTPPTTVRSDVRDHPGDQELLDHEDRCRGFQAGQDVARGRHGRAEAVVGGVDLGTASKGGGKLGRSLTTIYFVLIP